VHAHIWPLIHQPSLAGISYENMQALQNQAYDRLRAAADAANAAVSGLDVTTELITAATAPLLVEESERARLVVVGSRGLGGFTGLMVGSTVVALGAHAHCPVAVIRTPGEEDHPARVP
jgi:nucleotide-binding universal stress UspA family protein